MGTYFSLKAKMAIKDPIKSVTSIVAQRVIQQCLSTCLNNMAIQVVEFQPREHKIQWPYDSDLRLVLNFTQIASFHKTS